MADKEAVLSPVEDKPSTTSSTSTSQSSSTSNMSNQPQPVQGESLLLPLLQGLLDAPDASVHEHNNNNNTDCAKGDDLRSGLIVEVQSALDKLSACLCSDASDITNERRESLLQLVSKLQANLEVTSQPIRAQDGRNAERRSSGQSRFSKRKPRQGRHTVGVTSEELEDARRLMEEFALKDVIPLQKQNSESAVQKNAVQGVFRPVKFQPYKPLHIKNATAKPFTSSNNSSVSHTPSGASSTVNTPTEPTESLDLLFSEYQIKSPPHQSVDPDNNKYIYRQSVSLDQSDDHVAHYKKPLHQTMSLDYNNTKDLDLMDIQQAVQQAAATKRLKTDQLTVDSETDEDPSTLKAATPQLNTVDLFHHTIPKSQGEFNNVNQQPDLLLQSNPLFVSRDDSGSSIDKENRFNSKKLKMKRANTIDIPKPMKCYVDDNESEDDEGLERRQNSYIQLRGPLNVGKFNNTKIVPSLEPKTESDKKFMAFINRQNSEKAANSMVKTSIWDNHQNDSSSQHAPNANWNRKFGNIKTTFERSSSTESNTSQPPSRNAARSFWKSADDAHTAGVITYNGPKISKQSARNLQQMFEEKQKQTQTVPWVAESQNIVKGSLKVDAKIFEQSKNKIRTTNMFSHAPMSAFKPIQKTQINVVTSTTKTPTNNIHPTTKPHHSKSYNKSHQSIVEPPTPEAPLYLYSPKPFTDNSNYSSFSVAAASTSPTVKHTPWNQTSNESRVRNIAVAKFEATPEQVPIVPAVPIISTRKKSAEKVSMPKYLQQSSDQDKDRAPPSYISYSSATTHQNKQPQGGSVQKISGKYNILTADKSEPPPMQRHQSAFATVPQNTNKFQPNYQQLPYTHSITYSQPKIPYNTQYYSQVEVEAPRTKPEPQKLDQSRIYQAPPQDNYNSTQKYEPHKSHIVYNNTHSRIQPPNYNINRQSVIEQEPSYNSRNTPDSPYQNGHHLEYTTYTSQHLPQVETFVSSVSPPQMHYNDLYQRNNENPASPSRKVEQQRFSPPEPPKVPKYETQTSEESVHEYHAVSSRVMTGPVSQQAVNINQNGPKNRNQHDMDAAFSLKSTLQKIDKVRLDKSPTPPKKQAHPTMVAIMPNVMVNDKPLESLEINERGESVITSKFHIQVKQQKPDSRPMQGQALSKSDSWNRICQSTNLSTPNKPSPRSSPNARTVTKSKSTHTLALPKQFEAGMSRDEMAHKKQTMEAYFAGTKSPQLAGSTSSNKTTTINRTKTSQKMSVMRQNSSGLSRSRTLPDIVCADLLDESNVDEAFEDLFKAKSFEPSKQSFTEGPPVTTTQVSTTKFLCQQQVSKKPMSPFAKFKQLDRANSLNTPPTTPKTPGGTTGGGPMFKFTDPQLSRSASTIKERLLQWCQMKTKEYENIKLDNFSGSWADGLAFCALVHHFLPDAFDYTKLTPNNRRYNFTLAFQIADEKADIAPLLDVEDMVATRRPDWKCVFTYVQSIYRRFKDED